MALTRVQGATAHIDAVTQFQLDPADSPGVYVGIVNLTNIAGCVVHMKWVNQLVSGSEPTVWVSPSQTVDAGERSGIITVPMPVLEFAYLYLVVESGAPDGDVPWEIWRL
jgi:hypothetical protein